MCDGGGQTVKRKRQLSDKAVPDQVLEIDAEGTYTEIALEFSAHSSYVADLPCFFRASGALWERGEWLAEALGEVAQEYCVRHGFSSFGNLLSQEIASCGNAGAGARIRARIWA